MFQAGTNTGKARNKFNVLYFIISRFRRLKDQRLLVVNWQGKS
jgi:hypothetical protein